MPDYEVFLRPQRGDRYRLQKPASAAPSAGARDRPHLHDLQGDGRVPWTSFCRTDPANQTKSWFLRKGELARLAEEYDLTLAQADLMV